MSTTAVKEPVTGLKLVLEHVFDVRIDFHQRLVFDAMPGGQKAAYTSVKSGTVSGPRLSGKVLDYSGADWPIIRSDGVVELNAHYVLEADDGAHIYIRNLGYVYGPRSPADAARSPANPAATGYFRCTPYFRAPEGPHDWLNRTVVIGAGERHAATAAAPDHTLFRYYAAV
jgi:hypothetical protein